MTETQDSMTETTPVPRYIVDGAKWLLGGGMIGMFSLLSVIMWAGFNMQARLTQVETTRVTAADVTAMNTDLRAEVREVRSMLLDFRREFDRNLARVEAKADGP